MAASIGRAFGSVNLNKSRIIQLLRQLQLPIGRPMLMSMTGSQNSLASSQIYKNKPVSDVSCIQCRHMCYDARQVDLTYNKHIFMFDTHSVVTGLEESGFSKAQSEAIVKVLVEISQTKLNLMNKQMVTKAQQEIMLQQMMSHISSIKKDMIILEKSEFSALKHEYEKQHIEIGQMKQHFDDELTKLKSGVLLDLNLEKSRAREAHSTNENALSQLGNKIDMDRTEYDKQRSNLDNKIDREISHLLATYERYKNDTIRYAAGAVLTCLTLGLGVLRLWK